MQQNNGMSRAAAMAYRVLIRRGVSALPVHPLEILSACRNTVVWADVTAAERLKIPREALLGQLANAEAITFRQTIQGETRFIVGYREGGNPARLRFTLAHELGHRLLHRGDEPNMEREADCFASHLLCPRPTMGRLCARENTFSVEQAAALAYVSASALQRLSRVEELAVSPEICPRRMICWRIGRSGCHSRPKDRGSIGCKSERNSSQKRENASKTRK